jgi:hypothetical protein
MVVLVAVEALTLLLAQPTLLVDLEILRALARRREIMVAHHLELEDQITVAVAVAVLVLLDQMERQLLVAMVVMEQHQQFLDHQ